MTQVIQHKLHKMYQTVYDCLKKGEYTCWKSTNKKMKLCPSEEKDKAKRVPKKPLEEGKSHEMAFDFLTYLFCHINKLEYQSKYYKNIYVPWHGEYDFSKVNFQDMLEFISPETKKTTKTNAKKPLDGYIKPKEEPIITGEPPIEEDLDSHIPKSFSWADFVLRHEKNTEKEHLKAEVNYMAENDKNEGTHRQKIWVVLTVARQIEGTMMFVKPENAFKQAGKADELVKKLNADYRMGDKHKPMKISTEYGEVACSCVATGYEFDLED